jgi:hypothetical protein
MPEGRSRAPTDPRQSPSCSSCSTLSDAEPETEASGAQRCARRPVPGLDVCYQRTSSAQSFRSPADTSLYTGIGAAPYRRQREGESAPSPVASTTSQTTGAGRGEPPSGSTDRAYGAPDDTGASLPPARGPRSKSRTTTSAAALKVSSRLGPAPSARTTRRTGGKGGHCLGSRSCPLAKTLKVLECGSIVLR